MIKRLCPRCRRVIDDNQKYCIKCMTKIRSEPDKRYDRFKRNKDSKSFYNSKAWRLKRDEILARYYGFDLYELFINKKIVYAEVVHHISELIEEPSLSLDDDNLIPLSNKTHDIIHGMYKKDKVTSMRMLRALKKKWDEETSKGVSKASDGITTEFRIGDAVYKI